MTKPKTVRQMRIGLMIECGMIVFFTFLLTVNLMHGRWYNYLAMAIDAVVVVLNVRLVWLSSSLIASRAVIDTLEEIQEQRMKLKGSPDQEAYEALARSMINPN